MAKQQLNSVEIEKICIFEFVNDLNVVLSLENYPQNLHVLYCHKKLTFLLTLYVFGSCLRMLAVILVSDYIFSPPSVLCLSGGGGGGRQIRLGGWGGTDAPNRLFLKGAGFSFLEFVSFFFHS